MNRTLNNGGYLSKHAAELCAALGADKSAVESSGNLTVFTPIDGSQIGAAAIDSPALAADKIARAVEAFGRWRVVPAPRRGELIRLFGEELRKSKEDLARLVTIECGKILEEGRGEVQEMIDICDFAVGLSRQLYGLTIASERPHHVMHENWLPLGPVLVISAFNFPVAVWMWNFALAVVCGNSVVWKPSEKTPLCALACQAIYERARARFGNAPNGLSQVVIGDKTIGDVLVNDPRFPLVSATGSTRMGREVAPKVAARFGRSLLELGGNNAVIVTPSADLKVAIPSIVFGAVCTAGQRCTTTRRLIVHRGMYEDVHARLSAAYRSIAEKKIGDPLNPDTLVGPLIDEHGWGAMHGALREAKKDADDILFGQRVLEKEYPGGYYAAPALVRMRKQTEIIRRETFAPILYLMPYDDLEEAMAMQNDVPQGLSSAIFTTDLREAEYFKRHSDCGIANVNIGTSGAEIGGAFGGEKETGGGRESGSDVWKNYMRRQTTTTHYGVTPPALAQGIRFEL